MQTALNLFVVVLMLGFLWLVLNELGRSQKQKEDAEAIPQPLKLSIVLKRQGEGYRDDPVYFFADTVQELQQDLNQFQMFRIERAGVFRGKELLYVMDVNGILEAV